MSMNFQWESLSNRKWTPIDNSISPAIEAAFCSGAPTFVDLSSGISIDFASMKGDGFGRRKEKIRRLSSNMHQTEAFGWTDDHGTLQPYNPHDNEMLIIAEKSGHPSIALHGHFTYDMNLVALTQRNEKTGKVRGVAKLPSGTTAPLPTSSFSSILPTTKRGVPPPPSSSFSLFSPFSFATTAPPPPMFSSASSSSASSFSSPDVGKGDASAEMPSVDAVLGEATEVEASEEACPICMDVIDSSCKGVQLRECGHIFHPECIREQLVRNGKCALCNHIYVHLEGTQPKNGTMRVDIQRPGRMPLSGFGGDVGTIVITYNFPSGVQGPEHPHPGTRFSGTNRTAYLPDNAEGRDMLRMLDTCFKRRLTFTVGRSITTGQDNCVVWNGVHHKTNLSGGSDHFGWPDPTYFDRVKEELKAKGIS